MAYTHYVNMLQDKLPALEWQISKLHPSAIMQIPHGLFRDKFGLTLEDCLNEIKQDIYRLSQLHQDNQIFYLTKKIDNKIITLVKLCRVKKNTEIISSPIIKKMMRYQQWVIELEAKIIKLEEQKQVLLQQLSCINTEHVIDILTLKKDIGILEKNITELKSQL